MDVFMFLGWWLVVGGWRMEEEEKSYRLSVISGRGGRKSCRWSVEEEEMRLRIEHF